MMLCSSVYNYFDKVLGLELINIPIHNMLFWVIVHFMQGNTFILKDTCLKTNTVYFVLIEKTIKYF